MILRVLLVLRRIVRFAELCRAHSLRQLVFAIVVFVVRWVLLAVAARLVHLFERLEWEKSVR